MSGIERVHIWPREGGIRGIPPDWTRLADLEVASIRTIWEEQRTRLQGSTHLEEFSQRLAREWAIETGILENLYEIERGVTQTLIEQGFHVVLLEHGSTNRPREFVIQLLKDQKDTLDGLFDFVSQKRSLSTSYIKELHAALLRSQTHVEAFHPDGSITHVSLIRGDWKRLPNHATRDQVEYCYAPPEHVSAEMECGMQVMGKGVILG